MGFLDKLFGRQQPDQPQQRWQSHEQQAQPQWPDREQGQGPSASEDERAIARYQYLLRTAPPERVEQVHAEAFGRLTPEQRQQVLERLSTDLPPGEAPASDNPRDLARSATRAEMAQPGFMQRSFGGVGVGGIVAGSMLGTIAGVVVGSALAQTMMGGYEQSPEAQEAGDASGGDAAGGEASGSDSRAGEDVAGDVGGGDFGGDFGGFGDF